MHRASLPLLVLLAACPPDAQDTATVTGPGTSSSGASASDTSATASASTDPTSGGTSTTGPDPVTTTGATTSGDTTQSSDTTGLDTTSSDTTTADTTSTTAVETASTGDTGDTGDELPDTTGGELCQPGPEKVDIEWSLEVPPALAGKPLTAPCKVVGAQEMGSEALVTLGCLLDNKPQNVVLHYSLLPTHEFMWGKGEDVQLLYRAEAGAYTNEWLSVVGGYIYFRGVHADSLAPPDVTVEDFYDGAVTMTAPCDPQPDPCGQRQILELHFPHDTEGMPTSVAVRSGEQSTYGFPAPKSIWIEQATRLLQPIGCNDVAPLWIDMVVFDDFANF